MVQSEKNSVCHTPYLRNNTWYDFHLCIYGANDNIFRKIFFLILSRFWFSRFLGEVGLKGKKQSLKNSVRCTLYLRNHTSYDFHLWYTSVSWWYLQDFFFFFFFSKFCFFSKKAKNGPKWEKILPVKLHISESYIIWLSFVVDKYKMIISPVSKF